MKFKKATILIVSALMGFSLASCGAKTVSITFEENGGSSVVDLSGKSGSEIGTLPLPTYEGYTFEGWFSDPALTANFSATDFGKKDVTLYAKWLRNSFAVTFDANSGAFVNSANTATWHTGDEEPDLIVNPTRNLYAFGGWDVIKDTATSSLVSADGSFVTSYSNLSLKFSDGKLIIKDTGSLTLYADWVANYATISFVSNGGSSVSSITADIGSTIIAPAIPIREHYSFGGWFIDSSLSGTAYVFSTMPTNNLTLYAKWTLLTHSIVFHSNGGSSVATITADAGSEIVIPDDPVRDDGYHFEGWYSNEELTESYTLSTTMPSEDVDLYAKWEENTMTIGFVFGNDLVDSEGQSQYLEFWVVQTGDTSTMLPGDPIYDGHKLTGYSFDYDTSVGSFCNDVGKFTVLSATDSATYGYSVDATTHAITISDSANAKSFNVIGAYALKTVAVTFDYNGGTYNSLSSYTENWTHGSFVATSVSLPTRDGYTFNGFGATNASGMVPTSGNVYNAAGSLIGAVSLQGVSIVLNSETSKYTVAITTATALTLKAYWKTNSVSVSYVQIHDSTPTTLGSSTLSSGLTSAASNLPATAPTIYDAGTVCYGYAESSGSSSYLFDVTGVLKSNYSSSKFKVVDGVLLVLTTTATTLYPIFGY